MQDFIRRPVRRRRLFQRRPHPDIEFFFSRKPDQGGHGIDGPDDVACADGRDAGYRTWSLDGH
jgi:hypothetical protein